MAWKHSRTLMGYLAGATLAASAGANVPPATPTINEPPADGFVTSASDVHMVTDPFSDPDAGQTHLCSDWEIWQTSPSVRVWSAPCRSGILAIHIHLADGTFEGPLAGRHALEDDRGYFVRVRHSDNSGDNATRWSPWSQRTFSTAPATLVLPMELDDVSLSPVPTLEAAGSPFSLPDGAAISMVNTEEDPLLNLVGNATEVNDINNPPATDHHHAVRARCSSPGGASLPALDLAFVDGGGTPRTVYFPAQELAPGETKEYWISAVGGTYVASPSQAAPDFTVLAREAAVPWLVPPGYLVERFATGFSLPVNIAMVPNPGSAPGDPFLYVTELYGTIRLVTRDGTVSTYASGLVNFSPSPDFPGSGEIGLAGVCVDPPTGDLFATVVYASNPNDLSQPIFPKVIRLSSTDGGRTASTIADVRAFPGENVGPSHQISSVSIGPDGALYVHVGDGFDSFAPLNLDTIRGKVLRLSKSGQALASNPFYNAGDGISARDLVYAYGFRNPFGGAWRASDLSLYEVENGPSVDRLARVLPGVGYGYNGSNASMGVNALYNWNPTSAPVNIAFIEPATFAGSGFPMGMMDKAFVTQSGPTWGTGPQELGKRITTFDITPGAGVVSGPDEFAVYNGFGKATAVGLAAGPDGLYFTDLYPDDNFENPAATGANVLRIRYVGIQGVADCNSNGVQDAQDILLGSSQDCDENGVPDECDIASGRATDCNNNAIPDGCDTTLVQLYDFSSGTQGFTLNGSATLNAGSVRLTSASTTQTGSAVLAPATPGPIDHFHCTFDLRLSGGTGADGMSFMVLHADDFSAGASFGERGPSGGRFFGVCFDTFGNNGPDGTACYLIADGTILATGVSTDSLRGGWRRAMVELHDAQLSLRLRDDQGRWETIFLDVPLPGFAPARGFFAFGARTGALTDEHRVDNVTFRSPAGPDPCACVADVDDGSGTGVPDGGVTVDDLLFFLGLFSQGDPRADVDDGSGAGMPDGGVTVDDLIYFLLRFDQGC